MTKKEIDEKQMENVTGGNEPEEFAWQGGKGFNSEDDRDKAGWATPIGNHDNDK